MIFTGLKLKLILKRIFWGVLIIPCLLGYAICFAQDFSVTYQNGLLSVRADNTLIESLFDSIAGQCGISVKIYPEMKSVKVSRTFENKPLKDAIDLLVGGNCAIVYEGQSIAGVYILNRGKEFQNRNALMEKYLKGNFFELDELKSMLSANIRKNDPNAKLVDVIGHEDIEGDLRSYLFYYYTGKGKPPTADELRRQVNEVWREKRKLQHQIEKAKESNDYSNVSGFRSKIDQYDHIIRRNSEFFTVEVSADYDHPPVKKMYRGMPYDIAMEPWALEILNEKIQNTSDKFSFIRTFSITALGIGFEFQDAKKESYYVDLLNESVFTDWKKKTLKNQKATKENTNAKILENDRKKRINDQWIDLIGS